MQNKSNSWSWACNIKILRIVLRDLTIPPPHQREFLLLPNIETAKERISPSQAYATTVSWEGCGIYPSLACPLKILALGGWGASSDNSVAPLIAFGGSLGSCSSQFGNHCSQGILRQPDRDYGESSKKAKSILPRNSRQAGSILIHKAATSAENPAVMQRHQRMPCSGRIVLAILAVCILQRGKLIFSQHFINNEFPGCKIQQEQVRQRPLIYLQISRKISSIQWDPRTTLKY